MAAFYYNAVREYDLNSRDAVVAPAQDLKLTVEQLDHHIYSYAVGFLDGMGVRPGTTVAVWMGDEAENFVVQSACAVLGARVVVVDPATPTPALLRLLASEDVRVLFVTPRVGGESRTDALAAALEPELEPFARSATWGYAPLVSQRLRSLKFLVHTGFEPVDGMVRLSDLPVWGADGEYAEDEVAAVQFSARAGDALFAHYSAAGAKVDAASHTKVLARATAAAKAAKLTSEDTLAVTAPAHTAFGFAAGWLAALSAHAKLVLPVHKSFNAGAALAAITQQRATALVATGAQVHAMAAELAADGAQPEGKRQYSLRSLRAGLVLVEGGGSGPLELGGAKLKAITNAADLA